MDISTRDFEQHNNDQSRNSPTRDRIGRRAHDITSHATKGLVVTHCACFDCYVMRWTQLTTIRHNIMSTIRLPAAIFARDHVATRTRSRVGRDNDVTNAITRRCQPNSFSHRAPSSAFFTRPSLLKPKSSMMERAMKSSTEHSLIMVLHTSSAARESLSSAPSKPNLFRSSQFLRNKQSQWLWACRRHTRSYRE